MSHTWKHTSARFVREPFLRIINEALPRISVRALCCAGRPLPGAGTRPRRPGPAASPPFSAEHLAAAPAPQTPPDRRLHTCPSPRPSSSRHPCHSEPCPLGVPRHDTRRDCPGPSLRLTRCVRTSPHFPSGPRRVPPRPGAPRTRLERGPQWGQVGALSRSGGWPHRARPPSHTPAGPGGSVTGHVHTHLWKEGQGTARYRVQL